MAMNFKMDIYEFNKLSSEEKAEFTWKNSMHIESIKEGEKGFSLYKAEKFFIEVEHDENKETPVSIRALKNRNIIEKYIDSVELEKLF